MTIRRQRNVRSVGRQSKSLSDLIFLEALDLNSIIKQAIDTSPKDLNLPFLGSLTSNIIACPVSIDLPNIATIADVDAAVGRIGLPPGGFGALTDAVARNTADISQFANVPAILANMQATLANVQATLGHMQADIGNMQADIQADLGELRADVHALKDGIALANNRGCHCHEYPLVPRVVVGAIGPLPLPFPQTLNQLNELTGPSTDAYLMHYNLAPPAAGETVSGRRRRLKEFLGIQIGML
jgi:hypothetical protein